MPKATQLIRQDHKKVEGLFKKFKQTSGNKAKRRIAENAMLELEVHAALEEEIFYPAVEKEVDGAMVEEARDEHQTVKDLIAELKGIDDADEEFKTKFSELVENVKHHVEEEQNEMLPKVEESSLDLNDLGEQMAERKQELQKSGKAKKKRAPSTTRRKAPARAKSRTSKKRRA